MRDHKICVLLVEDVASDARMISLMLNEIPQSPFRLTTVNRLSFALRKLHRFKYDIVLLDLGLPDSKGIDTFKSLRLECPDVPIVIFTILGSEAIGIEAIRLGAQDYLVKGTSDERMLSKSIQYAIERKHLEFMLKQEKEELARTVVELNVANRELEAFSYTVAHDLRNPLQIIKGFVKMVIEDCGELLNEKCNSYLEQIKSGSERMSSIIDDMLALSKISRQEMEITEFDLSEMARLTIDDFRKNQPERKVAVSIQDELKVRADARLMSVAIGNLLNNAWKYTSKVDTPQIELGVLSRDGQKIYYVKDNGAGFDMRKADKLFAPFQRLHSDREYKGTGVGLAIVERAISRHGGKIWAQSEKGKGATFFFTLEP